MQELNLHLHGASLKQPNAGVYAVASICETDSRHRSSFSGSTDKGAAQLHGTKIHPHPHPSRQKILHISAVTDYQSVFNEYH